MSEIGMNEFIESGYLLRPEVQMPFTPGMHQTPNNQEHGNLDLTCAESACFKALTQMQFVEKSEIQVFTANAWLHYGWSGSPTFLWQWVDGPKTILMVFGLFLYILW
ncbi:hypothetical protein EH223_01690 [candidate division KSB1 bacterium]|nr:hypothetical protein [candidate division KSB1 bacterium]RQW06910.1 MAG: hypothetical protein EH223_01690 [candidate division KSB1 bacterium]